MSVKVAFFQPLLTASHSLHQQAKGLKKRKRKAKLKLRKLPLPVMQLKDYFVKLLHFMFIPYVVWFKKKVENASPVDTERYPLSQSCEVFYRFFHFLFSREQEKLLLGQLSSLPEPSWIPTLNTRPSEDAEQDLRTLI